MTRKIFLTLIFPLFTLVACNNNKNTGDPCVNDFDQEALFRNVADNLILPTYEGLASRVDAMQIQSADFLQAPDVARLEQLRQAWQEAYLFWQRAAQYEFGPAVDFFLRSSVNNFPLNQAEVDQNIQSGIYDFDNPAAYDKGFPALDYLLYGLADDDAGIVAKYTEGELSNRYRAYLNDVVQDIKERVVGTYDRWKNGYRETFVKNTGTAAGTSLSLIINNLNEHYEMIKRDKIGIPSGVLTLGFTNPDKVEAFHSGISAALAKEALQASEQFYLGGGGIGLDDHLTFIGAEKNGRPLDTVIREQFQAARQALGLVSDPLSAAVDNDKATVEAAYNEITKNVVNLKTDMPSVLCVAITYVDNPSDSD